MIYVNKKCKGISKEKYTDICYKNRPAG